MDAPDKSVTVSATVSGGHGVSAPPDVTLTITDDEATPTVALSLSPLSISENGGTANVTASLSGASSEAVTVTISTSPVSPAITGDYSLTSNKTLTIAPGSIDSAETVTITGVNNKVDAPDKSVTVSGTVRGGNGVSAPADVTLTITDNDSTPSGITLSLDRSPFIVSESAGATTVTVTATVDGGTTFGSSKSVTVKVGAPGRLGHGGRGLRDGGRRDDRHSRRDEKRDSHLHYRPNAGHGV